MNQRDYYSVVKWALQNLDTRTSVVALGYTGIGKTQIPQQVVRDLNDELDLYNPNGELPPGLGYDIRIVNVANQEAVDVKGVPMPVLTDAGHVVRWVPMPEMEFLFDEPERPTLVLIEELPQADQSVQKAWANILERNTRGIDGRKVSDKFVFVATGNRRQDRAGAHGILHHIESRFVINLELEAEVEPYLEYSDGTISPVVLSYLKYSPNSIVKENPNTDAGWSVNPRNWDNVDIILRMAESDAVKDHVIHEMILRKLGEEVGSDFIRHWKVALQLPGADDIEADPEGTPVPSSSSERWALANALGRWADDTNIAAFITYLKRFDSATTGMVEDEWARLFWHTIQKHGKPEARTTSEYRDFGLEMAKLYAH